MNKRIQTLRRWTLVLAAASMIAVLGCGGGGGRKILYIGGIPDQDVSVLEARFSRLAEYLSDETGLDVRYIPSVSYSAVVTGFRNNDIQLAWYGGLTGVQARLAAPGARAIAQRPRDAQFHSVFIARKGFGIESLDDLRGRSFTFGSESSTSGFLMPRYFLAQAGIDPDTDFTASNFSGSHDSTWKLVESGAFDAGALNAAVWERRVAEGRVDIEKVEAFWTTPPYYDYHWVARGDLDQEYGPGALRKLRDALLALRASNGGRQAEIMAAFQDEHFVPTADSNYDAIEAVARSLGIIED